MSEEARELAKALAADAKETSGALGAIVILIYPDACPVGVKVDPNVNPRSLGQAIRGIADQVEYNAMASRIAIARGEVVPPPLPDVPPSTEGGGEGSGGAPS